MRSAIGAWSNTGVGVPDSAQAHLAAGAPASEYDRPNVQASSGDPNDLAAYFRPGDPVPTSETVEFAAWTTVANVLLNLDETLMRR